MERIEARNIPAVIQGGMGIAVSSWRLAKSVSQSGGLGVVSGTAIDSVLVRRLQDGDVGGETRRALLSFPDQSVAQEILDRFFIEGGKALNESYVQVPKVSLHPKPFTSQLLVAANFVEVWLAKEDNKGMIGINLLEKIQLATPASVFGALLGGVDCILMGAGIPSEIPRIIRDLVAGRSTELKITVTNASKDYRLHFDPRIIKGVDYANILHPAFLAIVSSHALSSYLYRDEEIRPDGFIIEGPTAGGHNAPPRAKDSISEDGQSTFSEKDLADIQKVRDLGLPFWLAGGYSTPEKLREAQIMGAQGIQAGTIFALAEESGLGDELRLEVLEEILEDRLVIRTEPHASSTGFPFKVVSLPGTLTDQNLSDARRRVCDLGYLRMPYEDENHRVGYRCSSEPIDTFSFKNGDVSEAQDRKCLCNGLMANIGLGQVRANGYKELPLVTLGTDLTGVKGLLVDFHSGWTAAEVMEYLTNI